MNSLDSTDTRASNWRHIARLQMTWWFMAALGVMAILFIDPIPESILDLLHFTGIWTMSGLAVSSAMIFLASRLNLLSWRPAKQALAGIIGFVLGTAAFSMLFFTFFPYCIEKTKFGVFIYLALNFALWIAAAMAVGQVHRVQFEKREALKACAEKAETELRFVRQQVNSHLVFNALNSILVAIEEESPQAGSMVLDLSCLLRQSLETLPYTGTLGDEVERIQLYTRIEKSRFEDNLEISLDVTDDLLGLPCLPMVLQPLVENAIKHGFSQTNPPLRVDVRAEHDNGQLTIRVTNQGELARVDETRTSKKVDVRGSNRGIGLHTVRRRLEMEYGDEALLELTETVIDGEMCVTATIAWPTGARAQESTGGVMSDNVHPILPAGEIPP
jgi:hypothetical protein